MFRTILLIVAFAAGWFCPALSVLKPLMPWCLVYMLTVVFMRVQFTREAITLRHFIVIGANIFIAFGVWGSMLLVGIPERFAQAAFFTAITPTASASPVIVSLLGGSIRFASVGFILSGLIISAVLPLAVPLVLHQSAWSVVPHLIARVCFVILFPLCLGALLRHRLGERAIVIGKKFTASTLYTWILLVAIIAASASDFLRTNAAQYPLSDILWILLIALLLCILCFSIGALLGWKPYCRECSQLLGQKNTSYTTYLAFAAGAPFAALGPAFYVFLHNAWNGIQLILHKESSHESTSQEDPPQTHN